MKKNNVLIVYDDVYFYPYEENCVYPYKKNIFIKIIIKLIKKTKIKFPRFVFRNNLEYYDKIIISDSSFCLSLYKYCVSKVGEKNLILYYMNKIDENNIHMMSYFSNIYTFDLEDARTHLIKHKRFSYSDKLDFSKDVIKYDTLYLGRAKNRLRTILKTKSILDEAGLINKFMVLDTTNPDIKINSFLSYEEYLIHVKQSRCLVELNTNGQSGSTLRFLESIFFKKKLITDNEKLREDEYFNENNIFVLGKDDLKNLLNFIKSPYDDSKKIKDDLIFEKWIKDF